MVSLEFTLSLELADGLVWSRKHGQQGQVDTSASPLLRCLLGQQHQEQT